MKGILTWFAGHPVAANLLMIGIIVGGALTMPQIRQEVTPEVKLDQVMISVPYPGATPEEVEKSICSRIEESVQGLAGVDRVLSTAKEHMGVVSVEFLLGTNRQEFLDDIKSAIDRIDTFPEDAEDPIVTLMDVNLNVLSVAVWGDSDLHGLRRAADRARDALQASPEISLVSLSGVPAYEISIELSEKAMRQHRFTFDEVARAVKLASIDLPGGAIRAEGGEILLRTVGQAYEAVDFESIPLRVSANGERTLLGDVATIIDGFEETDLKSRFNGQRAVFLGVFRVGSQSAISISNAAKVILAELEATSPADLHFEITADESGVLRDRLDMMFRNARDGLILVLIMLALFLRMRLALWVTMGIPISFLGAIWLMPALDVSVNLISLFGFILVLGIVVDDAIVVAENIHYHRKRGGRGIEPVVKGALEVATPVIFAVLTTIAAFSPMLVLPGSMGQFARNIPLIVIGTLIFSLIESLLVLPHHLRGLPTKDDEKGTGLWLTVQDKVNAGLEWFRDGIYARSLKLAAEWRYATLALALFILFATMGYFQSGRHKFNFFPIIEADNVAVELEMPLGTPVSITEKAIAQFEAAARQLKDELKNPDGSPTIRSITTTVGAHPYRERQSSTGTTSGKEFRGGHLAEVRVELASAEIRKLTSTEIGVLWQSKSGAVPGAEQITFNSDMLGNEGDVDILLSGPNLYQLQDAADLLKAQVLEVAGVTGSRDTFRMGKREFQLSVRAEGEALGLTQASLARQVRQAFHGEEAQSVQRGRDEVKIMVRSPAVDRTYAAALDELRLRTPRGEIPFHQAATVHDGRGFSEINRIDRNRGIHVLVNLDRKQITAGDLAAILDQDHLPKLREQFHGITTSYDGRQRRQSDFMGAIGAKAILALLAIFVLLAIPLRSYSQPLVIMTAIPFGIVGAFWGHVAMDMDLAIFSIIGLTALSGVVVNDSLVMVDFINQARKLGMTAREAVMESGIRRFRAISLTTLTTFAGLTPLLLEKSMQAQFIMPMAVTLAFGVVFATAVTLILVPVLYLIAEDLGNLRGARNSA